jgi:hypothetical protein
MGRLPRRGRGIGISDAAFGLSAAVVSADNGGDDAEASEGGEDDGGVTADGDDDGGAAGGVVFVVGALGGASFALRITPEVAAAP